jgi:hypothetical protein
VYGPDATANDLRVLQNAIEWAASPVPVPIPGGAVVAPEPAGITLLGLGAAPLLGYVWRRRRDRAGAPRRLL